MSDEAAKTPEKIKPPVRILDDRLREAEYSRHSYLVTAPPGATVEDYLEPEAYAHVLNKVGADDVFTIMAEDRTWRCEVLVLAVNGQRIDLALLSKHEFGALTGKEHDAYEAEWAGPKAKYRVLRKSDRTIMVSGLGSKSEAVAWIEENAGLKKAA